MSILDFLFGRRNTATDPVCGMSVNRDSAGWRLNHEGVDYFFCSQSCKQAFETDPSQYLQPHAAGHQGGHH